jgi:uracil-DNA glycosylase family 4
MIDVTETANRLEELRERYLERHKEVSHLLLRDTYVGPRGPLSSPLLVLGEAPGEIEEDQQRPFAGNAGELVETLLREAGMNPDAVAYTNVLKFRPASNRAHLTGRQQENRKPNSSEIKAFSDLLGDEIRIMRPQVSLACGGVAASWCYGAEVKITQIRGEIMILRPDTPVMPTLHPTFLLYRRQETQGFERDLVRKDIKRALALLS